MIGQDQIDKPSIVHWRDHSARAAISRTDIGNSMGQRASGEKLT
jgi:hypothetical protein